MADLGTDQLLLDVAEYVVGYRVESAEALKTARERLQHGANWLGAVKLRHPDDEPEGISPRERLTARRPPSRSCRSHRGGRCSYRRPEHSRAHPLEIDPLQPCAKRIVQRPTQ